MCFFMGGCGAECECGGDYTQSITAVRIRHILTGGFSCPIVKRGCFNHPGLPRSRDHDGDFEARFARRSAGVGLVAEESDQRNKDRR